MPSRPPTIVHAAEISALDADLVRVERDTVGGLLDAVRAADDAARLLVAVDSAAHDMDEFVAVVSVLVVEGVQHIETSMTQPVQRIFDTHRTIVQGSIYGLES